MSALRKLSTVIFMMVIFVMVFSKTNVYAISDYQISKANEEPSPMNEKKDIASGNVKFENDTIDSVYMHTGKAVEPKPIVEVNIDGTYKILEYNVDYSVAYENNVEIGKATVIITGIGEYAGTLKRDFLIVPTAVCDFTATTTSSKIKLTWLKMEKVSGYEIYRSNNGVTSYKLIKTITGDSVTEYADVDVVQGKFYYYKIRAFQIVKDYAGHSEYIGNGLFTDKVKTMLAPSKVAISSVKNTSSKKITVKWKSVSGAVGYEVYRATKRNGKFTKVKTIKKSQGTVKYTDSKVKKGKTYYYKIRGFSPMNGDGKYGSYSNVKYVKVNK